MKQLSHRGESGPMRAAMAAGVIAPRADIFTEHDRMQARIRELETETIRLRAENAELTSEAVGWRAAAESGVEEAEASDQVAEAETARKQGNIKYIAAKLMESAGLPVPEGLIEPEAEVFIAMPDTASYLGETVLQPTVQVG